MTYEVRSEVEVPVDSEEARRVIAVDEQGVYRVLYLPTDQNEGKPEVTFDMARARGIAEKVMAGSARISTAHSTMLILAAAVLMEARR